MIVTGHWIARQLVDGRPLVVHWETIRAAWESVIPGVEECNDCWLAEVPF